MYCIRNTIYTDGYSVSFIFSKISKKFNYDDATQKQPPDFSDDIDNGAQVWAVDPGLTTVLTCVDPSGRQRTLSQDEYYHLCGFNDAVSIRKKHANKHHETQKMITELATLKTANMSNFVAGCKQRMQSYDAIDRYYNQNLWSV